MSRYIMYRPYPLNIMATLYSLLQVYKNNIFESPNAVPKATIVRTS